MGNQKPSLAFFGPLEVSNTIEAIISTPSPPRLPSSSSSLAVAKHHRLLLCCGLMQRRLSDAEKMGCLGSNLRHCMTARHGKLFDQEVNTLNFQHLISSWSRRFAVSVSCSGHGCLLRHDVNQRERSYASHLIELPTLLRCEL